MTSLPDFEQDAKRALLDTAERELYGRQGNIAFQFLKAANDNFDDYADRHSYEIESITDSAQVVDTSRSDSSVSVRIEWASGLTGLFEFGVDPHTIDGKPILSFIWEDPPQWVRKEFDQGRDTGGRYVSGWRVFFSSVEHPGIPESRAIRSALQFLKLQLEGETTL